jgi:hypothetical protein
MNAVYKKNLADFGHLADDEIMALTIWAEARGESAAGKIAVGTVILNRVEHRKWDGETIREVCLWPWQFSCFNEKDPNRARLAGMAKDFYGFLKSDAGLKDCYTVAHGLDRGIVPAAADIWISRACQYLTTAAKGRVDWWKGMRFIKKIGGHEFYSDV